MKFSNRNIWYLKIIFKKYIKWKKDKHFKVIKEIPLYGDKNRSINTSIYRTHDVYYIDNSLLSKDYQQYFDNLLETEEKMDGNIQYLLEQKQHF